MLGKGKKYKRDKEEGLEMEYERGKVNEGTWKREKEYEKERV